MDLEISSKHSIKKILKIGKSGGFIIILMKCILGITDV